MRGDVALFPFTYKCLCPYSLMNLMYHKFKKVWLNNKLRNCLKIHYRSITQACEHELGTFHTECPSLSQAVQAVQQLKSIITYWLINLGRVCAIIRLRQQELIKDDQCPRQASLG